MSRQRPRAQLAKRRCSRRPRTTSGCTSPASRCMEEHGVPIIVQGRGPPHLGFAAARSTSTVSPGCSWSMPATAASGWPRPRPSRRRSSPSSRSGPTRIPSAIELADRLADYAPGDLNRVFFSTGGGEAVETAFKLAKYYWKLQGRPTKHKVISRADRLPRHAAGRARDHRHPGHEGDVRAGHPRRIPGAEHELLPRCRDGLRRRPTSRPFGAVGGEPHRGDDPVRGPRDRRGRLPRAGAELGRMLPAAPRLLPARARDLRQVRRAARRATRSSAPSAGSATCSRATPTATCPT